ncbi:MAG: hypothetical protein ABR499_01240 [Gemmatimonadaceae bacterium]
MSLSRTNHPPELAGLATYAGAARVGYSVDRNVRRLLRYHWVERGLMTAMLAHLPSSPLWEVKCALALHQWQSSLRIDALRRRIAEMRSPVPSLDASPHQTLDSFLDELLRARDQLELVAGIYGVALPALAGAYGEHIAHTNPLVDHPTRYMLRPALADVEEAVAWGRSALATLVQDDAAAGERARDWQAHLAAYLAAAGGIAGEESSDAAHRALPAARSVTPFVPDFRPRRDERFRGSYNFEFPPHVVYSAPGVPADERNLALLCKRTLEMDVPEMMASFLVERRGEPWEFYRDYSRQLWDEARHAMMGTVAFEARGVDWTEIPLNVGFALRLNLHATPVDRQVILFAIEQSLMPSDTGKRFERQTAEEAGDALSAHFHDYDWADEVLHAQIGRRQLKRQGVTVQEAMDRAREVHESTWAALDAYKHLDDQRDWWPEFVRRVLGRETAVNAEALGEARILAE